MYVANTKFVEAYRASHPVQAHAIKFALEEAGIRVVIENEALQDGIGDIPCGWSSAPRLMVEESQLADACQLIQRTDLSSSSHRDRALIEGCRQDSASSGMFGRHPLVAESEATIRCLACDALMSESESTCPKCGWSYQAVDWDKSL